MIEILIKMNNIQNDEEITLETIKKLLYNTAILLYSQGIPNGIPLIIFIYSDGVRFVEIKGVKTV